MTNSNPSSNNQLGASTQKEHLVLSAARAWYIDGQHNENGRMSECIDYAEDILQSLLTAEYQRGRKDEKVALMRAGLKELNKQGHK